MRRLVFLCLTLVVLIGCAVGKKTNADKDAHGHDHDHGEGPHDGTVADWKPGDEYHVEFCVDHGKQQATVYVLGGDGVTDAPIEAAQLIVRIAKPEAFEVVVKASPQPKDAPGRCSRFVGTHPKLGNEVDFSGTIVGTVAGKEHRGEFVEN